MDAKTIINENLIGAVATVNADGSPWVTPVHVFADEANVYWLSTEDKTHSQNIARDPRTSLSLFSVETRTGNKGVYVNGQAEQLDAEGTEYVHSLVMQKIGMIPKIFDGAVAFKLSLGELNEQKSTGNCWYFYS